MHSPWDLIGECRQQLPWQKLTTKIHKIYLFLLVCLSLFFCSSHLLLSPLSKQHLSIVSSLSFVSIYLFAISCFTFLYLRILDVVRKRVTWTLFPKLNNPQKSILSLSKSSPIMEGLDVLQIHYYFLGRKHHLVSQMPNYSQMIWTWFFGLILICLYYVVLNKSFILINLRL